MAELHPPEAPINAATIATAATTGAVPSMVPSPAENANFPAVPTTNSVGPSLAPKRQRRPSVRLGEIGDQPATLSYDSHPRRSKPWRFHKDPALAAKVSKTRPLTNLVNGAPDCYETLETEDNLDFGNRKSRPKRSAAKRPRTNWTVAAKVDNGAEGDSREDNDDEFRDFEPEGSDCPLKEQSPVHSMDDVALDGWHGQRRTGRARFSESRDRDQDDGMQCGTSRDRNFGNGSDRGRNRFLDEGVSSWLIGLGLGRYAPVFEIHEVDDEVLPMLTLEDLKDMGINAVGSRRKCTVQFKTSQRLFLRFVCCSLHLITLGHGRDGTQIRDTSLGWLYQYLLCMYLCNTLDPTSCEGIDIGDNDCNFDGSASREGHIFSRGA